MKLLPAILFLSILSLLSCSSESTTSSTDSGGNNPPPSDLITCGDTEISRTNVCITTPASFLAIESALNRSYVLGADLDFTGIEYRPIGVAEYFTGSLDGNGHTISNITYEASATIANDCGAVFCMVAGVLIKNLGIKNVRFTAGVEQYSAGLVARCGTDCSIENVYVDGTNISSGGKASGGLIGVSNANGSTIKNIYVVNVAFADPLASNTGVLVGDMSVSTVSFVNAYYQNDTSLGNVPFGSGVPSVDSSYTGRTLAEMKCAVRGDCSSVFAGFDFVNIWTSVAGQNADLPHLR